MNERTRIEKCQPVGSKEIGRAAYPKWVGPVLRAVFVLLQPRVGGVIAPINLPKLDGDPSIEKGGRRTT